MTALAFGMLVALGGCTFLGEHAQAAGTTGTHRTATPTRPAGQATAATLAPAADHGPRGGAEGTVIFDGGGHPLAYVVASGDNLSTIAERLGITLDDLISRAGAYAAIHPGDRLSLAG